MGWGATGSWRSRLGVTLHEDIAGLTQGVARGDANALERFYERYFDWTYGEARRVTKRDESFCLDVVQDVMMRVIRRLPRMETEGEVRGWLGRTVGSCAVDRIRKETRRAKREAARGVTAGTDGVDWKRELAWVEERVAGMDRRDADLVLRRFRFGWTLARIGAVMGLKPGAVDGRLGRLVAKLRREAREAFDDD